MRAAATRSRRSRPTRTPVRPAPTIPPCPEPGVRLPCTAGDRGSSPAGGKCKRRKGWRLLLPNAPSKLTTTARRPCSFRALGLRGGYARSTDSATTWRICRQYLRSAPQASNFSGTKGLLLAVLEDGIRSYLRPRRVRCAARPSTGQQQPRALSFCFVVICETLGLEPVAVRRALERMRAQAVDPARAIGRTRPNVRRVHRVSQRGLG